MLAITNSPFSSNSMGIVSLETKGSKGGKGSRPEGSKPKDEPRKPFMIKGPIPPKEFRDPDIIYAETNPPGLPPGQRPYDKKKNDFSESEDAAIKTVLSWKDPFIYKAYAENARGSSSSDKSGLVTYDVVRSLAVGSSSDGGLNLLLCIPSVAQQVAAAFRNLVLKIALEINKSDLLVLKSSF